MNSKKWKNIFKEESKNLYKELEPFIKKSEYVNEKPIVEAKNLSHSFHNKVIYENISFEIFENEKLAFLGPNGAGKTLTVSTLCGYVKPKSGNNQVFV